jgi:hypothetical protein
MKAPTRGEPIERAKSQKLKAAKSYQPKIVKAVTLVML